MLLLLFSLSEAVFLIISEGMSFFLAAVCVAYVLCVGLVDCKVVLGEVGARSEALHQLRLPRPTAAGGRLHMYRRDSICPTLY